MNAAEKRKLSEEARLQSEALKRINRWKTIAFTLSAIGVALAYAGFAGAKANLVCGIGGIVTIIIGIAGAIVLNLGLKNGRRNVEKILDTLERA